jgi:hypothetical protein
VVVVILGIETIDLQIQEEVIHEVVHRDMEIRRELRVEILAVHTTDLDQVLEVEENFLEVDTQVV